MFSDLTSNQRDHEVMWNHLVLTCLVQFSVATQWVSECHGFRDGAGFDDGIEIWLCFQGLKQE